MDNRIISWFEDIINSIDEIFEFLPEKRAFFEYQKDLKTNKEYQEINKTSDRSASRDLENLISMGVFKRAGQKKGTYYEINYGGYGG